MFLRAKDVFNAASRIPVHCIRWAVCSPGKICCVLGALNETCGNQTNVTHYFVSMRSPCVCDKNRLVEREREIDGVNGRRAVIFCVWYEMMVSVFHFDD